MIKKNWKSLILTAFLVVFLATIFWAQETRRHPGSPITIEASLAANPSSFTGACPKLINFEGTIKASTACVVQYKFVRSDGSSGPVQTLKFLAAGRRYVSTTWTIGKSYTGWMAIEVLSPVSIKSKNASFSLTCVPKPKITNIVLHYYSSPSGEMDVHGTGFGATQGMKFLQRDGAANPGPYLWTDTKITALGAGIIPWEHVYQFAIAEGSTVLSNVFSKRFPYDIDNANPHQGPVGTEFNVYVWSLPSAPGGLVLKIGSFDLTILAWNVSPGYIKAKVPPGVPAGVHDVYLKKGTDVVSDKVAFTVL